MISFDVGALQVTIGNLHAMAGGERRAAALVVQQAGALFHGFVRRNISLNDHTLADLAAMDHPYARRHGRIKIHRRGSNLLTHPEFRVHTQSGRLVSALYGHATTSTTGALGYRVGLDPAIAPHARYVVLGTRKMLPRDVVWSTAAAPEVKKQIMRTVVRVLGKELRSKGGIRFGRGAPPSSALRV